MFTLWGRNTSIGRAVSASMLAAALGAGCSSDSVLTPGGSDPALTRSLVKTSPEAVEIWAQARPVKFSTLEKEQFGPFFSSEIFLITSAKDWEDCMAGLLEEGTLFVEPPPEAPDIDWSRESVVLISLGARPTTCYDVEIHRVRRHGSTVLVEVDRSRPTLGGRYCYQTYITPYHLIRIDRHPSMKRIREI